MTKNKLSAKSVLSLLAPFTLASITALSSAQAAEKMYGVFMVVKGTVKVQTGGTNAGNPVKVGSKVFEGDSVATAADSRAKIVMSDRNVINVSPDTQLKITKYQNNAATGDKNVEINLASGKVRNDVEQSYDGEKNKFLIKTPTAVAGVRGTKLITSFDKAAGSTSVFTIQGSVAVSAVNASGAPIGAPVMVNKGEMTTAAANKPAEAPKPVPKEEMKKVEQESLAAAPPPKETAAREVASDSGANKDSGSKDAPKDKSAKDSAASGPVGDAPAAPKMVDTKDLDVGSISKEIPVAPRVPASAPQVIKAPETPKIDTRPKTTTVIIRPTPTN